MKIELCGAMTVEGYAVIRPPGYMIGEIYKAVRTRYAGFRVINSPVRSGEFLILKSKKDNMATVDQVETFIGNKAKELGYTGRVKISWEKEKACG